MIVCMELLANDRQHALYMVALSSGEPDSFDSASVGKSFAGGAFATNDFTLIDVLPKASTSFEGAATPVVSEVLARAAIIPSSGDESVDFSRLQSAFNQLESSDGSESADFSGAEVNLIESSNGLGDADTSLAIPEASSIEKFDAALDEGFSRLDQSLYVEFRDFTYDLYNGAEDGLKAVGSELGAYAEDVGVPVVKPVIDQLNSIDYVDTISAGPSSVTSFARSTIGDINDLRSELLVG